VAVHPPHDVAAELRGAGLTPTAQRRAVLAELKRHDRPVTAQRIHARLQTAGSQVGMTTVYRVLSLFAEVGLVHVFAVAGERAYRQCGRAAHQHLICDRCGRVQEYDSAAAHRLLAAALDPGDFTPDPWHTDVHGVCGICRGQSAS